MPSFAENTCTVAFAALIDSFVYDALSQAYVCLLYVCSD